MKYRARNYKVMICALGMLGSCLAGCSHNDADPGNAAKAPASSSGMPADIQQQMIQSRATASPAALAAEQSAAMRAAKH